MNKLVCRLLLLLLLSGAANAVTRFDEIAVWRAGEPYKPGEVVTENYDIYVSLFPSRGQQPSAFPKAWKRVDLSKQLAFRPLKLYLPGQVVAVDGRYFLARRISALPHVKLLDDVARRWLEFTHPGLVHNIPPNPGIPPELDTLIGTDVDNDGIRDDYERLIVYSRLPNIVISSALDAGRIYGRLMASGINGISIDQQAGTQLLIDLVHSEQCRRQHAMAYEGSTWALSTYFNSLPRIEANFKLQNAVTDVVSIHSIEIPKVDPCLAIASTR